MAEAIIAGLLRRRLVAAEQVVGSHPRPARREELYAKYGVRMFESNRETVLASQAPIPRTKKSRAPHCHPGCEATAPE
jgi:pyrroline-5-carboxylate reductase